MKKFFAHLHTVNKHRALVCHYCYKVGLYWQGLVHDLSKYSYTEFSRGVKYYLGYRSPNDEERMQTGMSLAWLHHKGRNKHHFEYWIDFAIDPDTGLPTTAGMKMPKKYVAEMWCDRVAACKVYQKENYTDAAAWEFFQRSLNYKIRIHPDSAALLNKWLGTLKDQGEEAAIREIREDMKTKEY